MGKVNITITLESSDNKRLEVLFKNPETLFQNRSHVASECIRKGLEYYESLLK